MAELIPSVMFHNDDVHSDVEIAALNFELMDRLGNLKKGSAEYMKVAEAFHAEVAKG